MEEFQHLRGGLVAAIQTFGSSVFNDQVESFLIENSKFIIASKSISVDDKRDLVYAYAFCSPETSDRLVRKSLLKILQQFVKTYPTVSLTSQVVDDDFGSTIDKILGDLVLAPEERAGSIL